MTKMLVKDECDVKDEYYTVSVKEEFVTVNIKEEFSEEAESMMNNEGSKYLSKNAYIGFSYSILYFGLNWFWFRWGIDNELC